jgi:hypothetical protein
MLRVSDPMVPTEEVDFSKKIPLTESTIRVLKEFFNLKAQLTPEIIESLINQLEDQADTFANNLIFTTVVFNLINKYEQQVKKLQFSQFNINFQLVLHVESLKRILNKNTTYMKTPALTKLSKIKT